jgi:hypothetical protein
MQTLIFAGALVLSFVLGGVTTLVGFPRYFTTAGANSHVTSTVSPEELTRSAAPMPEIILENYQ